MERMCAHSVAVSCLIALYPQNNSFVVRNQGHPCHESLWSPYFFQLEHSMMLLPHVVSTPGLTDSLLIDVAYEFFSVFSHCASQNETTFYETKISPKALHQSCKIVTHIVILFSLHHEHVCFEILNQPFAELQSSWHVKGWVSWNFLFEAFGTYNHAQHMHLVALIIFREIKPSLERVQVDTCPAMPTVIGWLQCWSVLGSLKPNLHILFNFLFFCFSNCYTNVGNLCRAGREN